jgi:hypothetical protein
MEGETEGGREVWSEERREEERKEGSEEGKGGREEGRKGRREAALSLTLCPGV